MRTTIACLILITLLPQSFFGQSQLEQAFAGNSEEKMQSYLDRWAADSVPTSTFASDTVAAVHAVYAAFYQPQTFDRYSDKSMLIRPQPSFIIVQGEISYEVFSTANDSVLDKTCEQLVDRNSHGYINPSEDLDTLFDFRPKLGLDSVLYLSKGRRAELYAFAADRSREEAAESERLAWQAKWQDRLDKRESKGIIKKPRRYKKQKKAIKSNIKAARAWRIARINFLRANGLRVNVNTRFPPHNARSLRRVDGRPNVNVIILNSKMNLARVFFDLGGYRGCMNFNLVNGVWVAQDHCLLPPPLRDDDW